LATSQNPEKEFLPHAIIDFIIQFLELDKASGCGAVPKK